MHKRPRLSNYLSIAFEAGFSTLSTLDQFPHGEAEVFIWDGACGQGKRRFRIAPGAAECTAISPLRFRPRPGEDGASLGSRANLIANNLHSVFTTFTKEYGKHSFQFGSDFRVQQYNTASQAVAAAGSFTFNGDFTAASPTTSAGIGSGSGIAEILLGLPESGSLAKTAALALEDKYLGLYVQDTWKFNQRLTLTFGLRYDLETPYAERHNLISYGFSDAPIGITAPSSSVVPSFNGNLSGGLIFAGVGGEPRTEGTTDENNFGPRIGFAYQINSNTVIRGGYAWFYSPMADILSFLGNVATFSPSTPYNGSTTSNALPAGDTPGSTTVTNGSSLASPSSFTSLSNPFPAGIVPAVGSSQGPQSLIGQSIEFLNPKRVAPYNQQFHLDIDHQFPGQVLLTVAGVHVLSVKELESFNLNDLPLPDNTAANSTAQAPNPFKGIFPSTTTDGTATNVSVETLMTAYPQFSTVTEDGVNSGVTEYDGLQTSVTKRASRGLSVIGTVAWQKTMHNNLESLVNQQYLHNYVDAGYIATNGGAATPTLINWRSIGAYDQPKVWRLSVVYAPPITIAGSAFGTVCCAKQCRDGRSPTGGKMRLACRWRYPVPQVTAGLSSLATPRAAAPLTSGSVRISTNPASSS